jgi:LuxR family maltose regulon positive regulatory protein
MPVPVAGLAEASADTAIAAVPPALPATLPSLDSGKGRRLTPREREILALLEQSMSNKRIALVLNLSVDTVKWNLRQIYGKLNVSRRYDAILVARSAAQRPG